MKTVKMVDRDLNEAEVSTIERAMRLFLGENQFALIGENVIVPFENDDCSDPEMLEKCVEETTEEILSSHPDFETFFMKEKYGIVAMQDYKVLGFTAGSLSEDEEKKERIDFGRALTIRAEMMKACEDLRILAFVVFDLSLIHI